MLISFSSCSNKQAAIRTELDPIYIEQLLLDGRSFPATARINDSVGSLAPESFQGFVTPPFASPGVYIDASLHVTRWSYYAILTDEVKVKWSDN